MRLFTVLFLPLLSVGSLAAGAPSALDFQRDVRPILSNHCLACHGPDENARKGKLRLDLPEAALKPAKSGEPAIVPGKADASPFVARIFSGDEDEVMPPPHAKKPLTAGQKAILKRWIAEGAVYTKHWAFSKPQRPVVPALEGSQARIANPVDAFIVSRLQREGLQQSPQADPATLARRVALDLTGLPPTDEQLAPFLNAKDAAAIADAYEKFVDHLLQSPHYGERWARRWLDLARYADTNGYEKDRERSIWPYRDWVINALNADMPFDQFTIEQLAGDMLPNATAQQIVATGFHRNTMINEEGGIDPLEFRFHAMTDRVATTGATWLGLTLGCAQCHTHKYDPITHTEYYGLMAFLNNADEPDYDLPDGKRVAEQAANLKKADAMLRELIEKQRGSSEAAFQGWLNQQRAATAAWTTLKPATATTNMPLLTVLDDGSVLGSGDITKSDRYELTFAGGTKPIAALRLEALPHESLPAHGPGLCYYEGPKGDFFMGEFQISADGKPVKIAQATESYAKNNFGKNPVSAMLAVDGDPQTGWSCAGRFGERHEAVFVFEEPVKASELKVTMLFGRHYACPLGHFRISSTADAKGGVARDMAEGVAKLLLIPDEKLTAAQRDQLFAQFVLTSPEFSRQSDKIRELRKPVAAATTLVMRERPATHPRPTHRHHRGEFTQPKEAVQPVVLGALHPFPKEAPRNRLGLARWLVSPENPLTPRVVANRQWAAFFGRGLVATMDDFGFQGSAPTHPELLDWLATEFIRQGWSLKKLHRLIVMSATYRQSSIALPGHASGVDPNNLLLARFPRVRLDAEIIRDSLLHAAGLLTEKVGGPSVYPPQPESVTEAAYGAFKWTPSAGPDRYRRSLYTFAKRTAPFGMFTIFDGPAGDACLVKREASNTPLQALTSLNDIIFTEGAQALGLKLAAETSSDDERIRRLFLRVLSRTPDAEETAMLQAFVLLQRQRMQSGELNAAAVSGLTKGDALEAAVWALGARSMFNLDEFVTKG